MVNALLREVAFDTLINVLLQEFEMGGKVMLILFLPLGLLTINVDRGEFQYIASICEQLKSLVFCAPLFNLFMRSLGEVI